MDFRDNEAQLKTLVADILAEASKQGADQAEVAASLDTGLSVNVRKGELENLEFNKDKGFGITLYFGQRKGSASTTDSSTSAIIDTVTAARQIATHTQDDPCSGLADKDLMPVEFAELDLYHPWDVTPEQATELALECEAAGLDVDAKLTNSDGAQVSTQQSMRVYGNSHGFIEASVGTRHSISCVLIGEDANGMQRDYWYSTSRLAEQLDDVQAIGKTAGERTLARLSAHKGPTGSYPVLFDPSMASGLFGHLIGAISGGSQYRNSSFLLESLGKQVMPEWLSLVERPRLAQALGSANFDADGVATSEKALVRDGLVDTYILSTYSGKKLKMQTTGNAGGVHNLDIVGPTVPKQDLLKQLGTGLYVHELMGQGVNAVTGDYSRGAAGFWVENGEICYPVEEVTIAGNLKDMLMNIAAIGDDVDYRSNIRAPSVLLAPMTIAGE